MARDMFGFRPEGKVLTANAYQYVSTAFGAAVVIKT
jgi:hypothetical protein